MVGALRIAIAEDSAILRDGLVQLLVDRGFVITGAVGDPAALRSSVAQNPPDVAVIDIRMPPTFTDEGLRLALELARPSRGAGHPLFSQYIETRYAADLLADDAAGIGYLLKDRVADVSDFVEALERVAEEVPPWIPKSSRNSWGRRAAPTRCRSHLPRARGPRADGGGSVQRAPSPMRSSSARAPSRSTSPTSSPSSISRCPSTTTAGYWRSSASSSRNDQQAVVVRRTRGAPDNSRPLSRKARGPRRQRDGRGATAPNEAFQYPGSPGRSAVHGPTYAYGSSEKESPGEKPRFTPLPDPRSRRSPGRSAPATAEWSTSLTLCRPT